MKRSTQVSLVLMTVAGIGAGAYAMGGDCRPSEPGAPGDAPQGCRSSHGGGHSSGHGFYFFGSSGLGSSETSPAAGTTSRGGFGGTGYTLSGGG
jgi:hypothetical protein